MSWPRILAVLVMAATVAVLVILWLLAAPYEPRPLALGQEASFGFFDPHLHIAVTSASRGEVPPDTGSGALYLVQVRARSDAAEIAIEPGELKILVRDRAGREYTPVAWPLTEGEATSDRLTLRLGPGESVEQTFAFFLPTSAEQPTLRISEITVLSRWLPFSEDSWLHQRLVAPLPE